MREIHLSIHYVTLIIIKYFVSNHIIKKCKEGMEKATSARYIFVDLPKIYNVGTLFELTNFFDVWR